MRPMTIGRLADAAGVGVETVRFYERRGLIQQPPKPNGTGFRVYPEETEHRIRFIRQGQELGFSLREIQELLSLRAGLLGRGLRAHVKGLRRSTGGAKERRDLGRGARRGSEHAPADLARRAAIALGVTLS